MINIACCCYDLTFFLDKDRMITAVAGAIKLKLPRRIPTAKYFSRIPREEADPDLLHEKVDPKMHAVVAVVKNLHHKAYVLFFRKNGGRASAIVGIYLRIYDSILKLNPSPK